MGGVSQDIQNERSKCNFNVEELTYFLDGGVEKTNNRRGLENKLLNLKGLFDETPEEYLGFKEKYENAIRKAVLFYNEFWRLQDSNQTPMEKARATFSSLLPAAVFKENSPFAIHTAMFIPTIVGQADDEQQAYWLPKALNMEIIGTYAQTEMGHGTFIRGLETTATYDPITEEFILNSPTLTSYKWWPGNLGHTANHCIIMAQLYINGKSCGIQPFMVQVRDATTHMPLPGIKLGEIGAKLFLNTVNNGFLKFEYHRIPRNRMLMKNAQVAKDGTFTKSPNTKLNYGTMVYVRVIIVNNVSSYLGKAVTIAVRYSAVRRQSQLKPDEREVQILDYVTQRHKIFIAIATSHAFKLTANWLWVVYSNVIKDLEAGKSDDLPELHALACCLKAVCSSDAATMIEKCRLSCGGHGYMLSSNLPQLYGTTTATCTYEGENTVLMLQTARSLVKAWDQALKGKPLSFSMSYIKDKSQEQVWDNSVDGIIKGFQRIAARKLATSVASLKKYTTSGLSPEDAWNMTSVQLVAVSEAHCRSVILSTYKSEVERTTASMSAPLRRVMYQLVELYAVYWALEKLGDLLLYTSMSENHVEELKRIYEDLLEKIRPNAVGLVDAFDYRDEILNSTLGAYDGRVYERLMEEAMKSPLNAEPVNQSFHKYLKPFMQGKL